MKAEELRIGNYACMPSGIFIKVLAIGGAFITFGNGVVLYDELSGIRLTPEILEKCGFENKYGNTYYIRKLKFSYEHNEIGQFVWFHYSGKIRYIQYLHDLQNLFYALVGEELTINL